MKRTTFDENRDMQIADEATKPQALMCAAHGCPNLWSTSVGHLCRWHADAEPEHWPAVTREMLDLVADRAMRNGDPPRPSRPLSMAEKIAALQRLRTVLVEPKRPREWLHRLRQRQRDGERMSAMQRHCLQQCAGIPDTGERTTQEDA